MTSKSFEPEMIKLSNNPFSTTRSVCILEGVFLKGSEDRFPSAPKYIPITATVVEKTGILRDLKNHVSLIRGSSSPRHVMILADYGYGKTFALAMAQQEVYSIDGCPIISRTLSNTSQNLEDSSDSFWDDLIEDLESAYDKLDPSVYVKKADVAKKFGIDQGEHDFIESLKAFNAAFLELGVSVYIFLDELDKVITSKTLSISLKKKFLDDLKLISDNGDKSISLFVAGTTPCKALIEDMGRDYSKRFILEEPSTLTEDDTKIYVLEKCHKVLASPKRAPFTRSGIRAIYKMSSGNPRYIEGICNRLWNHASEVKKRLNSKAIDSYLEQELDNFVKRVVHADRNSIIKFISKIVAVGGKCSMKTSLRGFSASERAVIFEYIGSNSQVITKLAGTRTYRLDSGLQEKIIKSFVGAE